MKNLIVCSFLGTTLLIMLNELNKDRFSVMNFFPKGKQIVLNPLDGSFRKGNFDALYSISPKFLSDSSSVYRIRQLNESTFLLNQRAILGSESSYSLLLKVEADKIVYYCVIADFYVKSVVQKKERLYLLCDDFREGSYRLKLNCLDDSFNEIWTYSPRSREFPFEANSLVSNADSLVANVNVIGSCSICLTRVNLTFNEQGKLLDAKQNRVVNSGPVLDKSYLKRLFGDF